MYMVIKYIVTYMYIMNYLSINLNKFPFLKFGKPVIFYIFYFGFVFLGDRGHFPFISEKWLTFSDF